MTTRHAVAISGGTQNFAGVYSFLAAESAFGISGGTQNFLSSSSRLFLTVAGGVSGGTQNFSAAGSSMTISGNGSLAGGLQHISGSRSVLNANSHNAVTGGTQTFTGENSSLQANVTGAVVGGRQDFQGQGVRLDANAAGSVRSEVSFEHRAALHANVKGAFPGTADVLGSGRVVVEATNGLTTDAVIQFFTTGEGGGTLALHGVNTTVGALRSLSSGAGLIHNSGTAAATLTVDSAVSTTFGGVIENGTAPFSLVKAGSGTLTLTNGASTYTGGTTLKAGVLAASQGSLGTAPIYFDGGRLAASGVGQAGKVLSRECGCSRPFVRIFPPYSERRYSRMAVAIWRAIFSR